MDATVKVRLRVSIEDVVKMTIAASPVQCSSTFRFVFQYVDAKRPAMHCKLQSLSNYERCMSCLSLWDFRLL